MASGNSRKESDLAGFVELTPPRKYHTPNRHCATIRGQYLINKIKMKSFQSRCHANVVVTRLEEVLWSAYPPVV